MAVRPLDFKLELFPLHSPLLGESLLVSFPPLNNMLKFRGSSHFIWGLIHRWTKAVPSKTLPSITNRSDKQIDCAKNSIRVEHFHNNSVTTSNPLVPSVHPVYDRCNTFQFTSLFHMFLLATRHRVCGLYSQLSESNLPRTHTVVRLRFKGKEVKTPYPQSVVHQ